MYLVAVMDWFSRYVLAWDVSNTMESGFCVTALKKALKRARPAIFNTDQGSQFTSEEFTGTLSAASIRISMDGRGRALDNAILDGLIHNAYTIALKGECMRKKKAKNLTAPDSFGKQKKEN